ncbi:hypothetical protein T02_12506 [Trichinella nativa]|uniref:Uncharacterized protein n=1 Tax=Trichinella nativa TaxID=6335 RepID=A0A0V1LPF5_9BILA|nr:hypothetical protein T02_12506 [Trichinella nativa]
MGAGEIGVPCISYLILIDDNAMDDLEEVRILNRRREATILAMIDHYAFRKLGMCRFRCSITIQLLELLRWVNDLSMALIEQYHRISLDHYIMIMTGITLMCEDMAQLQQEEESTVIAIFAVLGIQDNHYIATRRRRRL